MAVCAQIHRGGLVRRVSGLAAERAGTLLGVRRHGPRPAQDEPMRALPQAVRARGERPAEVLLHLVLQEGERRENDAEIDLTSGLAGPERVLEHLCSPLDARERLFEAPLELSELRI